MTAPFHLQFLPAPAYQNLGSRKYPSFAALLGEIAWLLGVDADELHEIDNSDKDADDDLALWSGQVIGSFWRCPIEVKEPLLMAAE